MVNQITLLVEQVQQAQEALCTGNWRLNYQNCSAPVSIHSVDGSLWLKDSAGTRLFTYILTDLPEPDETRTLLYTSWVADGVEVLPVLFYLLPDGTLQVVVGTYVFTWNPASLDYGS